VLTAISGATLEMSIGGVAVTHTLDDVADMWFGEYLLLWRPPNGSSEALGAGSVGPGVRWLRQSLAAIDDRYLTSSPDSDVFDDELAARVREFQRDNRLDVDGLAGHQTQIIINTRLASDDTPRLTMPRLAQE
jgi:general secretion pathway protein A